MELLPWQRAPWSALARARQRGRLPHALLVTGPSGVGKRRFIDVVARSLLCAAPDADYMPCGTCTDCTLAAAGTHPDYWRTCPDPESKSNEIGIDAIRRLVAGDGLTSHRAVARVMVVDPAHRLTVAAANGLLKTLEEPAAGTLLILITEHPSRLPATVRSRCLFLTLPVPPREQVLAWLGEQDSPVSDWSVPLAWARGAPLAALELAGAEEVKRRDQAFDGFEAVGLGRRDPLLEAAAWKDLELGLSLGWLTGWVSDLARLATAHPDPSLINPDKAQRLRSLGQRLSVLSVHRMLQRLLNARGSENKPVNALVVYESLFVAWARSAN